MFDALGDALCFAYSENEVDEALVATVDLCVVEPLVTKMYGRKDNFIFADVLQK